MGWDRTGGQEQDGQVRKDGGEMNIYVWAAVRRGRTQTAQQIRGGFMQCSQIAVREAGRIIRLPWNRCRRTIVMSGKGDAYAPN